MVVSGNLSKWFDPNSVWRDIIDLIIGGIVHQRGNEMPLAQVKPTWSSHVAQGEVRLNMVKLIAWIHPLKRNLLDWCLRLENDSSHCHWMACCPSSLGMHQDMSTLEECCDDMFLECSNSLIKTVHFRKTSIEPHNLPLKKEIPSMEKLDVQVQYLFFGGARCSSSVSGPLLMLPSIEWHIRTTAIPCLC